MSLGTQNRVKKSYSISVGSEQYLRRYRKAQKLASDSAALERLLQEAVATEKLNALEAAYKKHYDEATEEELRQEAAWGSMGTEALSEVEWKP